jgi:hypothetical protein
VLAVSASARQADLAFDTLEGPASSDNYGMPMKMVSLVHKDRAFADTMFFTKTFASQEAKLAAMGKLSKHTQTGEPEMKDSGC